MDAGGLVSDSLIVSLVRERLARADCAAGFLLDGFPRTIDQADALQTACVNVDFVLEIRVPFDAIVERRVDACRIRVRGRTYHVKYAPPRVAGLDDVTGEPLVQRADDKEDTVRERPRGVWRADAPARAVLCQTGTARAGLLAEVQIR